jgi:flavin reductase (DIM6/NTAB) family NADH-FMN oxidoreductase RutF
MAKKEFYKGLDMIKPHVVEPTKLPRTCAIPVLKDPGTGYLNAGAYSIGVFSVNPFKIIIGVKSYVTAEEFQRIETFTVALGNRNQVDHIWVTAFHAPPGIDEIELADWHPLKNEFVDGFGIIECPVNLECRTIDLIKLPHPWRSIVIAQVEGVSVDEEYVTAPRTKTLSLLPVHEGGMHIEDAFYGLSTMSGDLENPAPAANGKWTVKNGKIFVGGSQLYAPENSMVLANCVFPRPSFIVITNDVDGSPCFETFSMGFIQSTEPAVHVPVSKNSRTWKNIMGSKKFTVSIPTLADLEKFEAMKNDKTGKNLCGFSLTEANMFGIPSITECPVSMDCEAYVVEDIPGSDSVLLLGIKVGATMDSIIGEMLDQTTHPPKENMRFINELYSKLIYKAFDLDMVEKTVHYDMNSTVPIKNIPVWGSRYMGAWWGETPARMYHWLIELCQMKILTKREFEKIHNELLFWNNGKGVEHLKSYYKPGELEVCRERLTTLLKAMVWAGRDMWKWDRAHALLDKLPDPYLFHNHHAGPMYYEGWSTDLYV